MTLIGIKKIIYSHDHFHMSIYHTYFMNIETNNEKRTIENEKRTILYEANFLLDLIFSAVLLLLITIFAIGHFIIVYLFLPNA